MTKTQMSLADRITALLDHLGIQRTHIVARMQSDWNGLAHHHSERIASLSLLCGGVVDIHRVEPLAERLYVMSSDLSPFADQVTQTMQQLPSATFHELSGVNTYMWTDITTDFGLMPRYKLYPSPRN